MASRTDVVGEAAALDVADVDAAVVVDVVSGPDAEDVADADAASGVTRSHAVARHGRGPRARPPPGPRPSPRGA